MANRGGLRPNAGRKKANHTIAAEAYKKYIVEEVVKQKGPLVKALIDKALTGDVAALKEVHDRALGKVKEAFDLTSGGKAIPLLANVPNNKRDEKNTGA